MSERNPLLVQQAERNFQEARKKARRERFWAWLYGKETSLIPFEVIQAEIQVFDPAAPTKQTIEVNKIVGSVGRYKEFTSQFLPLKDSFHDRWISVQAYSMERGWHPIDVYQVGNRYFVIDGNHRVAVARQMGNDTIEAHVSILPDSLDIDVDQPLDTVLIELGRANFMGLTGLDQSCPDNGLVVTSPGRFRPMTEQILRFRKVLEDIDETTFELPDAAQSWLDMVYLPTAMMIEASGLLAHFPERTVTDMFVWLFQHRRSLRDQYGEYETWLELLEKISADSTSYPKPKPAEQKTILGRVSGLFKSAEEAPPTIFDEL